MMTGFSPGFGVIVGVVVFMFFLTLLLLIYAKYCQRVPLSEFTTNDIDQARFGFGPGLRLGELRAASSRRFSGIDKTVIDSLPFFRFSSLKGARGGLECSVCLSKFEDNDVLRLVPKCKHAFHIACVDRWLESHSSCPLCRQKIDPSDLTIFTYSNSLRISRIPSDLTNDPNLELFVRREQENDNNQVGSSSSSRFGIGSSFLKIETDEKAEARPDEQIVDCEDDDDDNRKLLHKFKHMIIVSDVVSKNRWSDVNSSDLMLLNSEMLRLMSASRRFDSSASNSDRFTTPVMGNGSSSNSDDQVILNIREEMERKRVFEAKLNNYSLSNSNFPSTPASCSTLEAIPSNAPGPLITSGVRSVSETSFARFPNHIQKNRIKESMRSGKDDRIRKVWIPIARRTVQWFAGREQRSQQQSQIQSPRISNV